VILVQNNTLLAQQQAQQAAAAQAAAEQAAANAPITMAQLAPMLALLQSIAIKLGISSPMS
jgi:hypothetical protein